MHTELGPLLYNGEEGERQAAGWAAHWLSRGFLGLRSRAGEPAATGKLPISAFAILFRKRGRVLPSQTSSVVFTGLSHHHGPGAVWRHRNPSSPEHRALRPHASVSAALPRQTHLDWCRKVPLPGSRDFEGGGKANEACSWNLSFQVETGGDSSPELPSCLCFLGKWPVHPPTSVLLSDRPSRLAATSLAHRALCRAAASWACGSQRLLSVSCWGLTLPGLFFSAGERPS